MNLPGLGNVNDEDVSLFSGGSWSVFFDGSGSGLTTDGEDIDALSIDGDGALVISSLGSFNADGVTGADEDLFRYGSPP